MANMLDSQHEEEMPKLSTLQYKSLDLSARSFRLLRVLPGKKYEPIRCQLTDESLDANPRYIALSYTWNQEDGATKNIECNGASFRTGANLWNLLHRFRKRKAKQGIALWVDAICIDQKNTPERNHQVLQMRDIYAKAESAIAWLGEATGTEELAFLYTRHSLSLQYEELRSALLSVFNKPYWERVWIVQEFVLAQRVDIWCGEHEADAQAFDGCWSVTGGEKLPYWNVVWDEIRRTHACRVFEHRTLWLDGTRGDAHNHSPFHLFDLFLSFSDSKSSLLHDKVYAFLGLARPAGRSPYSRITPDYSKNISELFLEVFLSINADRNTNTASKDQEFLLESIETLQKSLRISRMGLMRVILELMPSVQHPMFEVNPSRDQQFLLDAIGALRKSLKASRVQQAKWALELQPSVPYYACTLAMSDFMVAPLTFVCKISGVGEACRTEDFMKKPAWNYWKDSFPGDALHNPLLSHLNPDANIEKMKDLDGSKYIGGDMESISASSLGEHGPINANSRKFKVNDFESLSSGSTSRDSTGHGKTTNDSTSYLETLVAISNAFEKVNSVPLEREGVEARQKMCFATFKGTNETYGVLRLTWDAFAALIKPSKFPCQIWGFSGRNEHYNALVIQDWNDKSTLGFLGFASVRYLPEVLSVWETPEHRLRHAHGSLLYDEGRDEPQDENVEACLHSGFTFLEELRRMGVLSKDQFDNILCNTFREKADEDQHACRIGKDLYILKHDGPQPTWTIPLLEPPSFYQRFHNRVQQRESF